ncbi:MAG: hypothetical protein EA426_20485 [Spirochaetaceae bacterium]|nr:MAG: hypothetical protein EA426_20485 [Spirochaetaceae bacterium]
MSDIVRAFLDSMLIENPVVMSFIAALLVAVLPRSARSSFGPALRFSLVFFGAALIGATVVTNVPAPFAPAVYLIVGLAAVGALYAAGELREQWMGMPQAVIALAPMIGVQMLVAESGELSIMLAASAGNSLGLAVMFIVIGSIRESSRMSETTDTFKTYPVVLFSMAVFAVILSGFLFW